MNNKKGAVLIFALMSMGIITILTQQLMKSVSVGLLFTSRMVIREQAELLVYGGLLIAQTQLESCYEEEKKKENAQPVAAGAQPVKKFSFKKCITDLVPHLNRWQSFVLTDAADGIDAEIRICIGAECGKLPYSQLFDEPSRELTKGALQVLKPFAAYKRMPAGDVAAKLGAALKNRTHTLADISGLLGCSQQLKVDLWYTPPVVPKTKKDKQIPASFALQDLCTLWEQGTKINPLFLSHSMCMVLGVRQPLAYDATTRKEQYKQLSEHYEKIKGSSGDELWKNLSLLYETKPKIPSEFAQLFSLEVEPRFYSVLCCATVAGVTQQMLAIIEHVTPPAAPLERRGKEQKKNKEEQPLFTTSRLYWL